MSDHMPECGITRYPICICDRLRAVEQRVLDDDVLAASYHGQKGYEVGFVKGYAAALDAAREAIEALLDDDPCDCDSCRAITSAQSVIEALRGEG